MRGAVARVLIGEGPDVAGTGFLIAPGVLVTCAHVVNMALGRQDKKDPAQPTQSEPVRFQLPHSDEDEGDFAAWVFRWLPLEPQRKIQRKKVPGDIALLAIEEPIKALPLNLAVEHPKKGSLATADGFPENHPEGYTSELKIAGTDASGWLICTATGLLRTEFGHSGSPVFDDAETVVGMVVGIQTEGDQSKGNGVGFVIPSSQIRAAWPAWSALAQTTLAAKAASHPSTTEIIITEAQLVQAFAGLLGEDPDSVFMKPNIPAKLINNARTRFAPGTGSIGEDIVILVDNSTGKSATGVYGIAFTEQAAYWRNPSEKAGYRLSWRQLATLRREIGIEDIDGHSMAFGRVLDLANNEVWAEDLIRILQPLLDTAR